MSEKLTCDGCGTDLATTTWAKIDIGGRVLCSACLWRPAAMNRWQNVRKWLDVLLIAAFVALATMTWVMVGSGRW